MTAFSAELDAAGAAAVFGQCTVLTEAALGLLRDLSTTQQHHSAPGI